MSDYCESIYQTKRWKTREVLVGNVGVGGDNPIRIQSMTTSNTRDVEATVSQIIRLADSGCEIVRVTVQGMKEAESCEAIKSILIQKGYTLPLVADIHFFPPAALRVVDFVDKVRINPGNFVDKRASFKVLEYDDHSYAKEITKIEEKFSPLVEKCKRLKKVMRIGTNHGSLSDRIMNRYGDTPQGMVESALEFARICRQYDYHDLIFSMKSSNPQVMILAYRLLVAEMRQLGWNYPLHLGVTEAGEGEDGRIKSAMGIGALLLDGIGDTIRVSLTEDAWHEIDPCKRLVAFAKSYEGQGILPFEEKYREIESITRRKVSYPKSIALHRNGSVLVTASHHDLAAADIYKKLGCEIRLGQLKLTHSSADSLIVKEPIGLKEKGVLSSLQKVGMTTLLSTTILSLKEALVDRFSHFSEGNERIVRVEEETPSQWDKIITLAPTLLILAPRKNRVHYARHFFDWLKEKKLEIPVILNFHYECSEKDLVIHAAAEYGALLCDGLGEGIWTSAPYENDFLRKTSFTILQAARMRMSKTDFISCPSCGRTLFDLQEVSKRIRERTAHLPGVKIAIMGCIVNGPGEMADADFGYVGSKPGMIDLYIGKQCVEKDIHFADGDDRLVALIKQEGKWADPE